MCDTDKLEFSTVLATAVHDMKNSLCMLVQSIETLAIESQEKNDGKKVELATLHYEASRLNSGLMQILALYRNEHQQLPVNVDECFIFDMLDELVAKNEIYSNNKGISIELYTEQDMCWYLDEDLVSYLINDIIVNALRYTKDKIKISASIQNQALEIVIEDNGEGYPQCMLNQTEYALSDFDVTRGRSGLGLFFAMKIAAAHKVNSHTGHISLKNGGSLGGSQFKLTLP